jgi:hypothetical protein
MAELIGQSRLKFILFASVLVEGKKMIQLKVNGVEQSFAGEPEMPLLWYLREVLGATYWS